MLILLRFMNSKLTVVFWLIFLVLGFSQTSDQCIALTIIPELLESANSVVRYEKITTEINDFDNIVV